MRQVMAAFTHAGLTDRNARHARRRPQAAGRWRRFLSPGSATKPGR